MQAFAAALLLAITLFAGAAQAQPPPVAPPPEAKAEAPKAKYGPDSTFRAMMADPKARALLDKHIPLVMSVFDSGMSEDTVTLQRVSENPQAQELGGFTPEVYKALLADLAKL